MVRESTTLPHEKRYVGKEWDNKTKLGNWDKTRKKINLIVIHTMDGFMDGTTTWFNRPDTKASAHYGISGDGKQIVQFVDERFTAYHCGNYPDNQRSIAIEVEDYDKPAQPRPDTVYNKLAELVVELCRNHEIPIDRDHIKGHREISSGKSCPAAISVDEVVRLCHALHDAQIKAEQGVVDTTSQPAINEPLKTNVEVEIPKETGGIDPNIQIYGMVTTDVIKFLEFLDLTKNQFKRKDGTIYIDIRSFVYDLIAQKSENDELLAPDDDGIPPVILDTKEYEALYTLASNFNEVADFIELTQEERVKKDAGRKVVDAYIKSHTSLLENIQNNLNTGTPNDSTPTGTPLSSYTNYEKSALSKLNDVLNADVVELALGIARKLIYAFRRS